MATGRGIRSSSEAETPEISEYHDDTASDTSKEPRSDTDSDDGLFRYPHGIYRIKTPPGFLLSRNHSKDDKTTDYGQPPFLPANFQQLMSKQLLENIHDFYPEAQLEHHHFEQALTQILSKYDLEFDSSVFVDFLLTKADIFQAPLRSSLTKDDQIISSPVENAFGQTDAQPTRSLYTTLRLEGISNSDLELLVDSLPCYYIESHPSKNTANITYASHVLYNELNEFKIDLKQLSSDELLRYKLDPVEAAKLQKLEIDLEHAVSCGTDNVKSALVVFNELYKSAVTNYRNAAKQSNQQQKELALYDLESTLQNIHAITLKHSQFLTPEMDIVIADIVDYTEYKESHTNELDEMGSSALHRSASPVVSDSFTVSPPYTPDQHTFRTPNLRPACNSGCESTFSSDSSDNDLKPSTNFGNRSGLNFGGSFNLFPWSADPSDLSHAPDYPICTGQQEYEDDIFPGQTDFILASNDGMSEAQRAAAYGLPSTIPPVANDIAEEHQRQLQDAGSTPGKSSRF